MVVVRVPGPGMVFHLAGWKPQLSVQLERQRLTGGCVRLKVWTTVSGTEIGIGIVNVRSALAGQAAAAVGESSVCGIGTGTGRSKGNGSKKGWRRRKRRRETGKRRETGNGWRRRENGRRRGNERRRSSALQLSVRKNLPNAAVAGQQQLVEQMRSDAAVDVAAAGEDQGEREHLAVWHECSGS